MGCAPDAETPAPNEPTPVVGADLGEGPDPATDPLGARLHQLAEARVGPQHEELAAVRGALGVGESASHGLILRGTFCYLFVAAASETVEELELLLADPMDVAFLKDRSDGNEPVLGVTQPVCPREPGNFRLHVRAGGGAGDYAVRVFEAHSI